MARVLGLETRHTARSGLLVHVLRSSVSVLLFKASLPCPQVLAEPNCALNCVQSGRSVAPQAEKERYLLGPTEHSSITHVEAAPFPPSCPDPTVQRKRHPPFVLCGCISPPSGCRERMQPCFYKRLNAGLYQEASFLSLLSFLTKNCRAGFNLGINLTQVRNLLLYTENRSPHCCLSVPLPPSSLFHPNLWSLKRLKVLLRLGIILRKQLLMS